MQKIISFLLIMMGLTVQSATAASVKTEVLYSWQFLPEILQWAASGPITQLFTNNYLYAWRTPTATFAYGDVPIRIKLKSDLDYIELRSDERDCRKLPETQKSHSVYYSYLDQHSGIMDYLLCSPKVIHSWSFGTFETIQEIKNEYKFVKLFPEKGDYYTGKYSDSRCEGCIFGSVNDQDKSEWKESALIEKIEFLEKLAISDLPRVFCAEKSEPCSQDHFKLSEKTYFGPVPVSSNYQSDPLQVKDRILRIYVDPELIQLDPFWNGITKKILKNFTSIDLVLAPPNVRTDFCIGFDNHNCDLDFAHLTVADQHYFQNPFLENDVTAKSSLFAYLLRLFEVVKISKFSKDFIQVYARKAVEISINSAIRKTQTSEGFASYFLQSGKCLKQVLPAELGVPTVEVSNILCAINH